MTVDGHDRSGLPQWQNHLRIPTSRRAVYGLIYRFGLFLTPTFLRSEKAPLDTLGIEKQRSEKAVTVSRRDTDYLDGLRGIAALVVCVEHFFIRTYPMMYFGYGFKDNFYLIQLPLIRGIFHGGTLVSVFFVISGFALSSKGIQLIRTQSPILLKALSSTTFRRSMRLFIPAIISSFMAFLLQRAGVLHDRRPKGYTSTLTEEIRAYFTYLAEWLNLFNWEPVTGFYNPNMWTIPVEFRCSLVVFLTLLGTARCRTGVRIAVDLAIGVYTSIYGRWDIPPFMWGMILAELHYYRKARNAEILSLEKSTPLTRTDRILGIASPVQSTTRTAILCTMLAFGMWLGSHPYYNACQTPTYKWMCKVDFHQPEKEKWQYITGYGAMLVCTAVSFLPNAQDILTSPLTSYLGKVSYALYLSHGPFNRAVALPTVVRLWKIFGMDNLLAKNVITMCVFVVYVACSFVLADVFMRVVDIPSVKLAQWIERKCTYNEDEVRRA